MIAFATGFLGACAPCVGSTLCGEAYISYDGRVTRAATGQPIPGARVSVTRTGGVSIEPERLELRTDSAGVFRIRALANGSGEAIARLDISGTPTDSVVPLLVEGVRLHSTRANGDVLWLGEWRVSASYPGYGQ